MEAKRDRHEHDRVSAAEPSHHHPMDGAPMYPTDHRWDDAPSAHAGSPCTRDDSHYGEAMMPYGAPMPYGGYDAGTPGYMGMPHPQEMCAYYRCMRAYYECLMAYHRYMMMMRDLEGSHR